ncbi:hypothetical protein ERJ75_000228600 [Trypanosoma vivax]|nr:hypothetical protein TRVL_08634 [Trypanosoma vivax]KAH8618903.1 hypothetical protein ERJ75_000228100 [Trypanosoma vivax]KAH8618909.1 hypothetical protein ERJ75_000228600 [Trypanosoma vivax]
MRMTGPTKGTSAPDMKMPSARRSTFRPTTEAELDVALRKPSPGTAPGNDETRCEALKRLDGAAKKCMPRSFNCSVASRWPATVAKTGKTPKANSVKEPRLANKRPDLFLQTQRNATRKKDDDERLTGKGERKATHSELEKVLRNRATCTHSRLSSTSLENCVENHMRKKQQKKQKEHLTPDMRRRRTC